MIDDRWALPPISEPCDRCAVPALIRIIFTTGDLYMCAPHYDEDREALEAAAVYIHDERLAPVIPKADIADGYGRMILRRGVRKGDGCRWCSLPLETRYVPERVYAGMLEYRICNYCDETAAVDMETLKGFTG